MKGCIEAGNRGELREDVRDGVERRQRLRLMQRSEISEVTESPLHLRIDVNGRTEVLAAVDDPVPDHIRVAEPSTDDIA